MKSTAEILAGAKAAKELLCGVDTAQKNRALSAMADALCG